LASSFISKTLDNRQENVGGVKPSGIFIALGFFPIHGEERVGLARSRKIEGNSQPLLRGTISAAPSAGSLPASAFANAAPAAAILCATARRTACNIPAAFLPPASTARARRTPDSNIAPSNLEAVAFHLPRKVYLG
jgi:hypothetical protein